MQARQFFAILATSIFTSQSAQAIAQSGGILATRCTLDLKRNRTVVVLAMNAQVPVTSVNFTATVGGNLPQEAPTQNFPPPGSKYAIATLIFPGLAESVDSRLQGFGVDQSGPFSIRGEDRKPCQAAPD